MFKYVLEHLEFFHENEMKQYDLVIGKALVTRKNTKRSQVNNGEHWNPGKIISSCGALFFQFVRIKNDTMYSCIVFMGSSDEARKYSYTCSVTSNMEETFMFKGPVFTVDRSFDDIIAISVFSIFLTIAYTEAPGGEDEGGQNIWLELGLVAVQIITGLVLAFALGWSMKFLKNCNKWVKFFVTLSLAIAAPFASDLSGFPESKFIFVIFFGFMCFRQWGEDKPEHELAVFWMFCQPFLFSTVGAAVLFSKIEPS